MIVPRTWPPGLFAMSRPERRSPAIVEPFRLLFDECPLPMWVHDARSLTFLEVNEAASRLYGYTREEFLALALPDILKADVPDESAGRAPVLPSAPRHETSRHARKDGDIIDVEIGTRPIEWDGRPACLAVARDVTRQVATGRALQESLERLQLAARATNDVMWEWDLVTERVWWTDGAHSAFGYSPGEVGNHISWWTDRIHPEDRERVVTRESRAFQRGEEFWTDEYRFQRGDGTYARFRDRAYILHDRDGRAVRMIGAMEDITTRKQAETALRENQDLLRQLAQAIQDVFYVSDARTNEIIFMNPAFDRIWGISREEIQRRPRSWLDRVHPDDRERIVRSLSHWKPQSFEPEWNEEFRIIRPDGVVRWIWIRSFPIRDASGQIIRFAGVERDVTKRKRTEETIGSLLAITRQLNATLDVEALMESLVKETLRLLDAEGGIAGLMTPEGMASKKYCTQSGVVPFSYCWPPGVGLPGWVAVHKRSYLTNDAAADPLILPDLRERFAVRSAMCMPLLDPRGEVLGFIAIHNKRDCTDFDHADEEKLQAVSRAASVAVQNALAYHKLEETAEALRLAEEKYRGIFENAAEGIGRVSPEGAILAANPAFARILGYDSPEALIASVPDIARIYVDRGVRAEMLRALETKDAIHGVEVQVRRRDGSRIWVLLNLRATRDERGRLQHYEGVAQDISARKKTEEELREVSGLLLQSQNNERRRIARELHDSTAQTLAVLAMNLSLVERAAGSLNEAARRKLHDSLELAQQCCREVRTLSYLLHPPALEEGDLWSALRWYTEGFTNRSGIRVDLTLPGPQRSGRLSPEIETTLFRIVQESLANIHRHSGSRRARIRVAKSASRVTLVVRDQGRGLRKLAHRPPSEPALLGVGIAGMRERVRQLGGEIVIDSSSRGTAVKVMLPLEH